MNKSESYIVKKSDERPARMDGTCFYCREPIGGIHKEGCVIRSKSVLMKYTITICRKVPEDWDKKMIEFHDNENTWCKNNLLDDLQNFLKKHEQTDGDSSWGRCLCANCNSEYLGEATEEDEKYFGIIQDE